MKVFLFRMFFSLYSFFLVLWKLIQPMFVIMDELIIYIGCNIPFIRKISIKNNSSIRNVRQTAKNITDHAIYDIYNGFVIDQTDRFWHFFLMLFFFDIIFLFVTGFDKQSLNIAMCAICCLMISGTIPFIIESTYPPLKGYDYVKYFKAFSKQSRHENRKWHIISFFILLLVVLVFCCEIKLILIMQDNNMSSYEAIRYVMNKYL